MLHAGFLLNFLLYSSVYSQDCTNSRCPRNSTCVNTKCACNQDFEINMVTGNCEPVDHCANPSSKCDLRMSHCEAQGGKAVCVAKTGYTCTDNVCRDIDECIEGYKQDRIRPCKGRNFESCFNTSGSFHCVCKKGYKFVASSESDYAEGCKHCCQDINECDEGALADKNIKACDLTAADCENTQGSYKCTCKTGFQEFKNIDFLTKGCSDCCRDYNECWQGIGGDRSKIPCDREISTCVNLRPDYKCECFSGYKEDPKTKECVDIDECTEGVGGDKNKPACNTEQAQCINTRGGFRCDCLDGYKKNDVINPNFLTEGCLDCCVDRNECTEGLSGTVGIGEAPKQPCELRHKCNNNVGGYTCYCDRGYKFVPKPGYLTDGCRDCCEDINECTEGVGGDKNKQACPSDIAQCVNTKGGYDCNCVQGYEQKKVDNYLRDGCLDCCIDIDECATKTHKCDETCEHGTRAQGAPPGVNYTCGCNPGKYFTNNFCDECEYEEWGESGVCVPNDACGDGQQVKYRVIQKGRDAASCKGEGYDVSSENCYTPCPSGLTCILDNWDDWSECTEECGGGTQERTRKVYKEFVADACKDELLKETQDCNKQACSSFGMSRAIFIVVGTIVGLVVIFVTIFYCYRRQYAQDDML